ncbi:hypothetical protein MRB53_041373 [Persea americana]|nr:hypothetical protein MRB53_041373 [Persea americana]
MARNAGARERTVSVQEHDRSRPRSGGVRGALRNSTPPLLPHATPDVVRSVTQRAAHNAFSIRPATVGDEGEMIGLGRVGVREHVQSQLRAEHEDVRQGEELCITYLGGEEAVMNVEERSKDAAGWLGLHVYMCEM